MQPQRMMKSLRNQTSTNSKHVGAFNEPSQEFQLQEQQVPSELKYDFQPTFSSLAMYPYPFQFPFTNQLTVADYAHVNANMQPSQFFQSLPLKHVAAEGMRIVCEIDILLLKNYYPLRDQIFNKSNQSQPKRMDSGANNVEWLKGRLTYRFKTKISHSLNKLVDEVNAILQNKTEEETQHSIVDKITFEGNEFIQMDKEMKERRATDFKEYLVPKELIKNISKWIEIYLQNQ